MCDATISCTFVPGFHYEDEIKKMTYNYLGQTGFKVSEIALGTAGFNDFYGSHDEKCCIDTVHEALRSGINYIDTAPWYGQSEEILGKALQNIPRKSYYIATKVGRYDVDSYNRFDYSAYKTRLSIENSLEKLGLDYVDIIQVHDIEFAPSVDYLINECIPMLKKLLKEGKAKYIGITGYPLSVLKECIERSNIRISTILTYSRMTLIDDTLNMYMPFFNDKRVGVINGGPAAMGLLTNQGPPPWHPAINETKEICQQAVYLCQSQRVELSRLALHHAFAQKIVPTNIVGMKTVTHLKNNLDVYYNGLNCVEKDCLEVINNRFFNNMTSKQRHWEGLELAEHLMSIGM